MCGPRGNATRLVRLSDQSVANMEPTTMAKKKAAKKTAKKAAKKSAKKSK